MRLLRLPLCILVYLIRLVVGEGGSLWVLISRCFYLSLPLRSPLRSVGEFRFYMDDILTSRGIRLCWQAGLFGATEGMRQRTQRPRVSFRSLGFKYYCISFAIVSIHSIRFALGLDLALALAVATRSLSLSPHAAFESSDKSSRI